MSGTMERPADQVPRTRREIVVPPVFYLLLMVAALYAYFYNGAWHNQNGRYDAIFTFVEPGPLQHTFRIDPWVPDPQGGINTYDWSRVEGRYYTNKAPATLFLGVAVYWPIYHLERLCGVDPTTGDAAYINAYLINLGVTVLPALLALPFFFGLVGRLTGDPRRALLVTASLYGGTMMFTHATQFWGHVTVAALAIMALWFMAQRRWRYLVGAGFFAAMCALAEYPAGIIPVVMGVAVVGSLRLWRAGWRRRLRPWVYRLLAFGAGAIGPFVVHCLYHWICFGSPLTTANAFANDQFVDQSLAGGMFGLPALGPLLEITVLPFRGLFWMSPVLLLALPGFVRWYRRQPRRRSLLWLCVAIVVLFFLMNASFNGWHAGATVGPRYLIPMLPFLVIGLAFVRLGPTGRWVYGVLLAVSLLGMLAVSSVIPIASDSPAVEPNPVQRRIEMFFAGGLVTRHNLPIRLDDAQDLRNTSMTVYSAFNLGTLHGLSGLWSLLPLGLLLGGLAVPMMRSLPPTGRTDAAEGVARSTADTPRLAGRTGYWLVLGAAAVLALAAWYRSPWSASNFEIVPDSVEYAYGAKTLWRDGTYHLDMAGQSLPSRYPPGFSLVLVPALWLAGGDPGAAIWPVLLCAALGLMAAGAIGWRVAGAWGACLTVLALLWHPTYGDLANRVLTDVPAVACLLASAAIFLRVRRSPEASVGWYVVAGLLLAVAVALRVTALATLLPWAWLGVDLLRRRTPWRRWSAGALALVVPVGAVMLATMVYNSRVFGSVSRNGYHFWTAVPYDYTSLTFGVGHLSANVGVLVQAPWIVALVVLGIAVGVARYRAFRQPVGGTQEADASAASTPVLRGSLIELGDFAALAAYLACATVPILLFHLLYFFQDIRLFLPCTVALVLLAAIAVARLVQRRVPAPVALLVLGLALAVTVEGYHERVEAPPPRRLAAERVAAHTPDSALILSGIDPLYFQLVLANPGQRQFLPFSRHVEYASKVITPERIAAPQPPPASAYDHRAAGLLAGGAREVFPWTPADDLDRLIALARMGAPIYLEASQIPAADQDALTQLQGRFALEPIDESLFRLHLLAAPTTPAAPTAPATPQP